MRDILDPDELVRLASTDEARSSAAELARLERVSASRNTFFAAYSRATRLTKAAVNARPESKPDRCRSALKGA
jgi:hypothetical protein